MSTIFKKKLQNLFNRWIISKADHEDAFYQARDKKLGAEPYSIELVKKLLAQRAFNKPRGKLRILKVYQDHNWEDLNLLPALQTFGEVTEYPMADVRPYSFVWQFFKKRAFGRNFLRDVSDMVKKGEIDVIFFYTSGLIFQTKIIAALSKLDVPMINLALDDYLKFKGYPTPTGWSGNVGISRYMTLTIISYKEAASKYLAEGAIPLYLPEGGNASKFKPLEGVSRDLDVCFIGKNYGLRESLMKFLRANGVNLTVYGRGWPEGPVSHEKMVEIFSRAKIALGVSDSWGSGRFDIPGRDFEVPLMGPMYLTEENNKIGAFYDIGKEMVLYRDREDLLQKIRYYLSHDAEREEIARKGRERALREHTWEKRFDYVFKLMSILS